MQPGSPKDDAVDETGGDRPSPPVHDGSDGAGTDDGEAGAERPAGPTYDGPHDAGVESTDADAGTERSGAVDEAPPVVTGETAEIDPSGRTAAIARPDVERAREVDAAPDAGAPPGADAAPDAGPPPAAGPVPGAGAPPVGVAPPTGDVPPDADLAPGAGPHADPGAIDDDARAGQPLREHHGVPVDDETPAALAAVQGASQRVRHWWRRAGSGVVQRWVISLVVASLVVVIGLLVADRWALMRARDEVDQAFDTFTEEIDDPDVRLDGFPFLPQVVSGRIDRIDFTADRMVMSDITLLDVTGWATGIGFRRPVEVAEMTATGTVPLEIVQEQVADATFDVPVLGERSFEADIDGTELVLTTSILGGDIHVTAEVTPTDDGRGIHIHLERGRYRGVSTELASIPIVGDRLPLDHYVELDALPENLVLTETTVIADGIRVTVEGEDVPL
ncbi:MAG: LmeA family phospholipid-binding protein [Actinomycetaceae bacterium]